MKLTKIVNKTWISINLIKIFKDCLDLRTCMYFDLFRLDHFSTFYVAVVDGKTVIRHHRRDLQSRLNIFEIAEIKKKTSFKTRFWNLSKRFWFLSKSLIKRSQHAGAYSFGFFIHPFFVVSSFANLAILIAIQCHMTIYIVSKCQ